MKGRGGWDREVPTAVVVVELTEEEWPCELNSINIPPPLSSSSSCVVASNSFPCESLGEFSTNGSVFTPAPAEIRTGPLFLGVVLILAKGFFTGDGVTHPLVAQLPGSADVGELSWSSLDNGLLRLIFFVVGVS